MADARQLNPQDRTDAVRFARSYWADRGRYASDEGCYRVRTKIGFVNPDGDRHGWLGYWAPWDHCRLVLNGNEDWSDGDSRDPWWDLCSTVIHEYGHLVGRGHSRNPNSVMAGSMQLNSSRLVVAVLPRLPLRRRRRRRRRLARLVTPDHQPEMRTVPFSVLRRRYHPGE